MLKEGHGHNIQDLRRFKDLRSYMYVKKMDNKVL